MINKYYDSKCDRLEDKYVISDCLLKYGYRQFALDVQYMTNNERLPDYLHIIVAQALSSHDNDVIDRLSIHGLI